MEKPPVTRESDKFMLRFPDGMRDRLKEAAHANGRSMNAEIVARLQQSLDQAAQPLVSLVGKIGGGKTSTEDLADHLAALPPEELSRPLSDLLDEMRQAQRQITEAAEKAERTVNIIRRELPPGTKYSSDPLSWLRRMAAMMDEVPAHTPPTRPAPKRLKPPKRTSLRKHIKR